MGTSRLVSMLLLLQVRGRVTAQALAEEFEVSVRTIYRDIDQLSAAGVPIYADRGPGGGFALLGGYRTNLTGMTRAEAELLPIAALPTAATDLGLAEELRSAQLKLVAALPDASHIGSRLHIDPVAWHRRAEPVPHLPLLAQAVWDRKRISMRYESWTATTQRRCEPLGLVLKGGSWYLMARSGQRISIYKAAGILELDILDETFERPAEFDLREQWARHVTRFEKDLLTGQATLRLTREGLSNLHHLGAAAAEQAYCGFFDEDGWCEVTLPVEHTAQAAAQLLRLGPHVRVLAPVALREAVRELASRIAQLNAH